MPKEKSSNQHKQYELPQATVNRLIKEVCSPKINVGKNAKSAISKSAAVFILYLAWNANEICTSNGRSTIQAQDVLNALEECEFSEFIPELEAHLAAYRQEHQQMKETEKTKANERRKIQRQKSLQELKERKQRELMLKQKENQNNNNNNNNSSNSSSSSSNSNINNNNNDNNDNDNNKDVEMKNASEVDTSKNNANEEDEDIDIETNLNNNNVGLSGGMNMAGSMSSNAMTAAMPSFAVGGAVPQTFGAPMNSNNNNNSNSSSNS